MTSHLLSSHSIQLEPLALTHIDGLIDASRDGAPVSYTHLDVYKRQAMHSATIRPIHSDDDAAMAAIIRSVMPEFGATGSGFAISDPEVDWMQRAYAQPRHAYFVLERDGRVLGLSLIHI